MSTVKLNDVQENLVKLKSCYLSLDAILPLEIEGAAVSPPRSQMWKLESALNSEREAPLTGVLSLRGHYRDKHNCKISNIVPCITTQDLSVFSFHHTRFLNGHDLALLQGIPAHLAKYLVENYNNFSIRKFVGNTMSINVLCALYLSIGLHLYTAPVFESLHRDAFMPFALAKSSAFWSGAE